jgi:hypothetical protein
MRIEDLKTAVKSRKTPAWARRSGTGIPHAVFRSLVAPFFPWKFMLRNLVVIAHESDWRRLPERTRRAYERRLWVQRAQFYREVNDWLQQRPEWQPATELRQSDAARASLDQYCDHCGECCEIASGLAEFLPGVGLSLRWQTIFGHGLGRWHRFCPFLWENQHSGRSLCAIHQGRPLPCRAFERDECLFLKNDTSPQASGFFTGDGSAGHKCSVVLRDQPRRAKRLRGFVGYCLRCSHAKARRRKEVFLFSCLRGSF